MVNSVFKEPIFHVLEKIKNDPFFKWPNKMGGDPTRRNQNLYLSPRSRYRGLQDIAGFSGPVSQSWEVETIYASTPQTRIAVRVRALKGCCALVILGNYQCYLCDPKEGFQPYERSNDDIFTIKS